MSILIKIVKIILLGVVKIYQGAISPLIGQNCRHVPTCSAYATQAITVWGPFKGGCLSLKRLLKCHPWGTSGYDPVPQKKKQV